MPLFKTAQVELPHESKNLHSEHISGRSVQRGEFAAARRGYEPIDEGALDDWGYAFRMVRGSTDKLSNHASGTAIDLNATKHPLGKVGTFPSEKVAMIRALAKKYGLKWGGDYKGRIDEMHFEIELSEAKVAALIGSLKLGEN